MTNEVDGLGAKERDAFDRLEKEKTPPLFLEGSTIAALKDAGVIRSQRTWLPGRRGIGTIVAASIGFFILGVLVGFWSVSAESKKPRGPVFALILRDPPRALPAKTRDETLKRMQEYIAWGDELERQGLMLGHDCQLLSEINGPNAGIDLSLDAAGGSLAGVFLLQVENEDQAVSAAQSCPVWTYGGTVEIRQLR